MRVVMGRKLLVFLAVFALAGISTSSFLMDKTASEKVPSVPVAADGLSAPDDATRARVVQEYGQLPLSFEENVGQTDAQVRFLSRGSGYALFLTDTEAVLSLHRAVEGEDKAGGDCSYRRQNEA